MRKLLLIVCLLAIHGCDKPEAMVVTPVQAQGQVQPQPPAQATTTVTLIDIQTHGYAQAPAWFVRVRYSTTSSLPHIVIESQTDYNGHKYANVRVVDLAKYEYDVFYDGAAPSGRIVRVYPAEVAGVSWHDGKAWLNHNPFPYGTAIWHIDIPFPDSFLHPRAGHIVQADYSAAVDWEIDVTAQSVVTVRIP